MMLLLGIVVGAACGFLLVLLGIDLWMMLTDGRDM